MSGYLLGVDVDDQLVVTDLADGRQFEILDLGLLEEHWPGVCVLGRIVPTSTAPGLMFEARPLPVDPETAQLVARDSARWFEILVELHAVGKLPQMFSYLEDSSLVSDLPQRAWLSLLEEHQIPSLPQREGRIAFRDLAMEACENLLQYVDQVGQLVATCRHSVASLLLEPGFVDTARSRFTGPGREQAWQTLSQVVPEPARSHCLALAELSEQRASRAS